MSKWWITLLLPALCAPILFATIGFAAGLPMPTLALRQQASAAFAKGETQKGKRLLEDAVRSARQQALFYVQVNELRYIAALYASAGLPAQAHRAFAEAMHKANRIQTWNHRLYASIGVVEMQRQTGDLSGVRENGLAAIEAGLLETIAATGEAAETGRFFTALQGTLTPEDIAAIRARIARIADTGLRRKALHGLERASIAER